MSSRAVEHVAIAANHGEIGGGEVMLLRIAEALRTLGVGVTVVAPSSPRRLADAAEAAGFDTVVLRADGRRSWMRQLRRWDRRHREGILWCNGLTPAVATAGHRDRIVHLHQQPEGIIRRALTALARTAAAATLIPSPHILRSAPGARVLPNWTTEFRASRRRRAVGDPYVVGFLGRLSVDKGVDVLAEAIGMLERDHPGRFRLALAGEPRFVGENQRAQVEAALTAVDAVVDRLGWVDPQEFFDTIDLLVVPSTWGEPFGLVAAEAMSARVPLVVSDAGALPEVVGRDSGRVVRRSDSAALACRIAEIAQTADRGDVERARDRWERLYSPAAGAERVGALLASLSAGRRRGAANR